MDLPKFNLPDFSKMTIPNHFPGIQSIMSSFKQPNMEMREGYLAQVDEISSIDFLEKWYSSGENFQLSNIESVIRVLGNVQIDLNTVPKKYGIIENFEFEDSVIFLGEDDENLTLTGECIVFLNCRFKKKLFFKNCRFERGKSPHNSYDLNSIEIRGGFVKEVLIDNCELNGLLLSKSDTESLEVGQIDIKNCKFLNGSISFENAEVTEMCDINFNNFNRGLLRLVNNKFRCGCRFSVNKNLSLHFYGKESVFEKPVFIYQGSYKSVDFSDIQFHDEVDLVACSIEEELKLIGNTFEDKFWVLSKDETNNCICTTSPDEVWIQNNRFQNGFKLNPENQRIDRLIAIFSEISSGVMEFENGTFNYVQIFGSNFNNSVFFRDCHYSHLDISNFFNRSLISFNNNVPSNRLPDFKEIRLENSNLGNTEFYDFDFTVYPVIRIIDSRLDNIFANGVEWFKQDQLHVEESETDPKKILSQKREIYRQLKLAAEKQSDRIMALEFKAKEVETHRLFLKIGKVKKTDRWAILAGKTNDHGQNWIKPLLIVLFTTLLAFYPLIVISADPTISWKWDWSAEGWNLFCSRIWNHFDVFWQLFNPARRLKDMFPNQNIPAAAHFWDGFQRIFLAFFIFQIVSAFRKFVK